MLMSPRGLANTRNALYMGMHRDDNKRSGRRIPDANRRAGANRHGLRPLAPGTSRLGGDGGRELVRWRKRASELER